MQRDKGKKRSPAYAAYQENHLPLLTMEPAEIAWNGRDSFLSFPCDNR